MAASPASRRMCRVHRHPAFKSGLWQGVKLGLFFALLVAAVLFGLAFPVHAETQFDGWQKVQFKPWAKVSSVTEPEVIEYPYRGYGSVQPKRLAPLRSNKFCNRKNKDGSWTTFFCEYL